MLSSYYSQLGFMYRYTDDYANAEAAYMKSAAITKKKGYGGGGMEAPIAELKRIQGKYKEALALYEESKANIVRPDQEHFIWPFDGEYWRDELGFYRQTITSKCAR